MYIFSLPEAILKKKVYCSSENVSALKSVVLGLSRLD